MRRSVRRSNRPFLRPMFQAAALVLVAVIAAPAIGETLASVGLYEPQRADFPCPTPITPAYGRRDCNAYFSLVQKFYHGVPILVAGWTARARRLLSKVGDPAKPGLTEKINVLGRTIATEWAKENEYRRIHTYRPKAGHPPDVSRGQGYPNMEDLNDRLGETFAKETGDGRATGQLVDMAQRIAEKAIRGEPLSDAEKVWRP